MQAARTKNKKKSNNIINKGVAQNYISKSQTKNVRVWKERDNNFIKFIKCVKFMITIIYRKIDNKEILFNEREKLSIKTV